MGRMNDIEKKKTLYQVLSRLRDIYIKLQVILEWNKVANEHLALKLVKQKSLAAKESIIRLIGAISHFSNNLISRRKAVPSFEAYKDLLTSSTRNPGYFAASIAALSPDKSEPLSETEQQLWLSTLEALIRDEISRNIINVPRSEVKFLSITEGKAKISFLNLFEFVFTLVPSADHSSYAWFILDVKVEIMKEIFKNSLTGIFQFKYNNKPSYDSSYLKAILEDCSKYIELFHYEKMFSQFSFFSNSHGKGICSFQRSPQGDWFKFRPWWLSFEDEAVRISFSNESRFKVESEKLHLVSEIFKTSLSFQENECQMIFENLFATFYMTKLESFFLDHKERGILCNVALKTKSIVSIELFENFVIIIRVDPFTKKFKFDFIENNTSFYDENFPDSEKLSNSLIIFDSQSFTEIICRIKREIINKLLTRKHPEIAVVNCPDIPSTSGLCLKFAENPSVAFSLNISAIKNSLQVQFWSISVAFQNGFISIDYRELNELGYEINNAPSTELELASLVEKQKLILLSTIKKDSFANVIKSIGVEGEFIDANNFRIFSFGLPSCIEGVYISTSEDHNLLGKLEFGKDSGLNQSSIQLGPADQNNVQVLFKAIRNSIVLLAIWEHLNLLEPDTLEAEKLHPIHLKFKKENTSLTLNEECEVIFIMDEQRITQIESFIESKTFSIYEFVDKVTEFKSQISDINNNKKGSPDLTWLSESFM